MARPWPEEPFGELYGNMAALQSHPGKGNDPSTHQLCILGSEDIILQKEMIFPKLREELSIRRAHWLSAWGAPKYSGGVCSGPQGQDAMIHSASIGRCCSALSLLQPGYQKYTCLRCYPEEKKNNTKYYRCANTKRNMVYIHSGKFSSVQSPSRVPLFATP